MIDLHAHSTHSDGSLTPVELVHFARLQGLSALALTDHDITTGLDQAAEHSHNAGIRFIPGVELEINYAGGEFHLLGLNLVGDRGFLETALVKVREHRSQRNQRIIQKMREDGLPVTEADIATLASGRIISRLHFATYLVKAGRASSISEAFTRYLNHGRPYFDPKKALDLEEAITLIHVAGGKAVIAHPYTLGLPGEDLNAALLSCREKGLDGIEAYHSDYPLEDCRKLEALGRALGLGITAGSDFHGATVPSRKLGRSAGGMEITAGFLDWLA